MIKTKFKKSRVDLAEMQSTLSIMDINRSKLIRAIGALKVADEMYEMLNDLAQEYHCQCGHQSCRIERTRKEIDALLAKARGELK